MYQQHACLCYLLLLPTAAHLPMSATSCCAPSSLIQLSNMSESEDVLLEFFVSLPQLKQVTIDKEELVTNIVDMASKFLFCISLKVLMVNLEREVKPVFELHRDLCICVCHVQRKTFRWSHSWKEKDKKCSTRSDITSYLSLSLSLIQKHNRHIHAIV